MLIPFPNLRGARRLLCVQPHYDDNDIAAVGTLATLLLGESFCGQDAQYLGNQPSYTPSTDALAVCDNVTGLTWTQGADWTSCDVTDPVGRYSLA